MSREIVRIKNWPFEKGEQAKLIWIGEPFKQNNKWMVYAYFKVNKVTKKIMLDWASIHFLSVDKYYTDGNLNNGEIIGYSETININLSGINAEYKERDWEIWGGEFKDKTKSKTFNFVKGGTLYTIPIIEVIRAVIAPDKFMLNRILEMDTLENYFTYEIEKEKLDIHFTSEYESKLLKSEKVNHIAWLLTNSKVFKMFNSVGENIWNLGELKFNFLIDNFNIKARVERKEKFVRVLQIVALNKKKINVEEINIYHPSLEELEAVDISKKRKFVMKSENGERNLDTDANGSTDESEEIDTFTISHEYESTPKINRKKSGIRIKRKIEDENTKTYIIEDDNLRTTADTGGEETVRGLEFKNLIQIHETGELQEFVQVLKLLEKRQAIKYVEIVIDNLPEGTKGKKFSKLKDGITKRKYAIGKIIMMDGTVNCLIEVEREDRALSMLLLKVDYSIQEREIYFRLLFRLVNESGKWSNNEISKIERSGVKVYRIKHTNRNSVDRANFIFEKLK